MLSHSPVFHYPAPGGDLYAGIAPGGVAEPEQSANQYAHLREADRRPPENLYDRDAKAPVASREGMAQALYGGGRRALHHYEEIDLPASRSPSSSSAPSRTASPYEEIDLPATPRPPDGYASRPLPPTPRPSNVQNHYDEARPPGPLQARDDRPPMPAKPPPRLRRPSNVVAASPGRHHYFELELEPRPTPPKTPPRTPPMTPPMTPPKPTSPPRSPSPDTAAPSARGGPQIDASIARAAADLARQRRV